MARRSNRFHMAVINIPPDDRPVGPLTNDGHPYGLWDASAGIPTLSTEIYVSGVMRARGGEDATWNHGVRGVSSYALRRGANPLGREQDDDGKA